MSNLTISRESVLNAAKGSEEAFRILKELFPDVVTSNIDVRLYGDGSHRLCGDRLKGVIELRRFGSLKDQAFWLNESYNWAIVTDSEGAKCLVPTMK